MLKVKKFYLRKVMSELDLKGQRQIVSKKGHKAKGTACGNAQRQESSGIFGDRRNTAWLGRRASGGCQEIGLDPVAGP